MKSGFLSAIVKPKVILVFFFLFLVNAVTLVIGGKKLSLYSKLPKLDFLFNGYDATLINNLFLEYGVEGRNIYFWLNIIDIPFPVFVVLFCYGYFAYTWKKWNFKWVFHALITLALFFFIFDSIENFFIYQMLIHFPLLNSNEIFISSISTKIKLISLLLVYLAIPTTLLVSIYKTLQNGSKGSKKFIQKSK